MKNDFENLLDEIRVDIYEKTKGMSSKEAADTINANARILAKKYGIKIAKEAGQK